MRDWMIVGDADIYGKTHECLIKVCRSKEKAEEVLDQMFNNPTKQDLKDLKEHRNIRIKQCEEGGDWWNDPVLVN